MVAVTSMSRWSVQDSLARTVQAWNENIAFQTGHGLPLSVGAKAEEVQQDWADAHGAVSAKDDETAKKEEHPAMDETSRPLEMAAAVVPVEVNGMGFSSDESMCGESAAMEPSDAAVDEMDIGSEDDKPLLSVCMPEQSVASNGGLVESISAAHADSGLVPAAELASELEPRKLHDITEGPGLVNAFGFTFRRHFVPDHKSYCCTKSSV